MTRAVFFSDWSITLLGGLFLHRLFLRADAFGLPCHEIEARERNVTAWRGSVWYSFRLFSNDCLLFLPSACFLGSFLLSIHHPKYVRYNPTFGMIYHIRSRPRPPVAKRPASFALDQATNANDPSHCLQSQNSESST